MVDNCPILSLSPRPPLRDTVEPRKPGTGGSHSVINGRVAWRGRVSSVLCSSFAIPTFCARHASAPQEGWAAARRLLRAVNGRLFIPDILRTGTWFYERIAAVREQRDRISSAVDKFRTLTGSHGEFSLLGDDAVDQLTLERLGSSSLLRSPVPIGDEILIAMVMGLHTEETAILPTDHGYKDCLIWEACCAFRRFRGVVRFAGVARPSSRAAFAAETRGQHALVKSTSWDTGSRSSGAQASNPALDLATGETADLVDEPVVDETAAQALWVWRPRRRPARTAVPAKP